MRRRLTAMRINEDNAKLAGKDCPARGVVMEDTQMAMSVAVTKEALDFNASMTAALIGGTFEKSAEMQAALARDAGLAAEGIGKNLNIKV